MPLFYDKVIENESRICIWEITESLDELLEISGIGKEDLNGSETVNPKRQQEWIAIRLLLKQMLGQDEKIKIFYDEHGKPHLNGIKKNISISHTKRFAGVIMNDKKFVGIDLEIISPRIEKISHRFLNDAEKSRLKNQNRLEQLYILWGAKECAFKIYAEGGVDFKEMLEVKKFDYADKGRTIITLKKNNISHKFPVWWEKMDDLMIVHGEGMLE
jgi:4'-phosphopantetheinyl transferase